MPWNTNKNLLRPLPGKFTSPLAGALVALSRIAILALALSAGQFALAADVVEFYNSGLDHYFITANPNEAAAIDSGSAGPGWARTGYKFAAGGSTPVCRFYGSVSPGPNSHLYSLQGAECSSLMQLQTSIPATQPRWNFESLDFMSTPASGGACPSGTVPVYRAYNNGFARNIDSNHRLASDSAAMQEVVARGWIYEGLVMCAPAPTPVTTTCKAGVTSGFTGDLNALYTDRQGGGGGNGEGSGSGNGAGAGAGEGKILNAQVTVTRLSDGVVLGSAVTDNVNGLITIKPCAADGPLLLTISGGANAMYYDEARGQLTPFGAGQVLHALVDYFDENIGISAITEAAFRYALSVFSEGGAGADASAVADTRSTGSLTGLTLAQVQTANKVVLDAFNALLDDRTKLVSAKSLPTPVDQHSSSDALPLNRYGIAATVIGGFVKAAGTRQPSSTAPALGITEQLARDLTDGKLDGLAKGGAEAATGANVYYTPTELPAALKSGMISMAQQFGKNTTATLLEVSPYAGDWYGPMSGDINGIFTTFSIDAAGNFVNFTGNGVSNGTGVSTGTLSKSGAISYSYTYSYANSYTPAANTAKYDFNGNLSVEGTGSGTWVLTTNEGPTSRGTWQASKQVPSSQ